MNISSEVLSLTGMEVLNNEDSRDLGPLLACAGHVAARTQRSRDQDAEGPARDVAMLHHGIESVALMRRYNIQPLLLPLQRMVECQPVKALAHVLQLHGRGESALRYCRPMRHTFSHRVYAAIDRLAASPGARDEEVWIVDALCDDLSRTDHGPTRHHDLGMAWSAGVMGRDGASKQPPSQIVRRCLFDRQPGRSRAEAAAAMALLRALAEKEGPAAGLVAPLFGRDADRESRLGRAANFHINGFKREAGEMMDAMRLEDSSLAHPLLPQPLNERAEMQDQQESHYLAACAARRQARRRGHQRRAVLSATSPVKAASPPPVVAAPPPLPLRTWEAAAATSTLSRPAAVSADAIRAERGRVSSWASASQGQAASPPVVTLPPQRPLRAWEVAAARSTFMRTAVSADAIRAEHASSCASPCVAPASQDKKAAQQGAVAPSTAALPARSHTGHGHEHGASQHEQQQRQQLRAAVRTYDPTGPIVGEVASRPWSIELSPHLGHRARAALQPRLEKARAQLEGWRRSERAWQRERAATPMVSSSVACSMQKSKASSHQGVVHIAV